MMEFHISRGARDRYRFADTLFSFTGNVVFANVSASREFAYRMNQVRDVQKHPDRAVHAAALFAMGLIDEASHVLMASYRAQFDPMVMIDALSWFSDHVGSEALDRMLVSFVEQFPGTAVYRGEQTPQQWLAGSTDGTPHRAAALEELMLLWMANRNEAFRPFDELFEDKSLAEKTAYVRIAEKLPVYFATRPLVPVEDSDPVTLFDLLRAPALAAPNSLSDQLALIRKKWKPLLGEGLERFLLLAGEVLREEELAIWMMFNPPAVAARTAAEEAARRRREMGLQQWPSFVSKADVPTFSDVPHEYERFSPDVDWMPNTVLIAKSTYVWLAQLSRSYGRPITRLDEIPDEELDALARRGMNSLWLIGIWERSRASKTIKQLMGNHDAVASAYSLFDYAVSGDLGGDYAYDNLKNRAFARGIRLASDMVPNHMGIDSPWVVEHPDWFISRKDTPYPAYNFDGPDLSQDPRCEIKIESHYFDQSDAAVVFRRRDNSSGETRYIYHGNDGTSFPWNDTAQLDYLNPAVREQVIQTILHVARQFPIIRFDAAMTLAKRHFHRLWFPGPGATGSIPSRAEYGMSDAEFNKHMPAEFWREVVDRVAVEVPGTLLLAEAFWMMEGYFVRTLGMHRVYNSAFMIMLRDEDNAKYRSVIKNTLEFDPDIMKRYVNFMSNPDERTAIDQFGTGDKCFGVATMMATLPGLPMFGHGQVEGFTEKYGMEYQRPRYDETADQWLVERHERQIAPLLHQRSLFAESSNFLLYDFFKDDGTVDENVFAYSNRRGDKSGLVIYNNRYSVTHGTIHYSAAYADKQSGQLRQQKVSEGMHLTGDPAMILAYRDSLTGLEFLRRAADMAQRGLTVQLHAYQCHVFLNWHELRATAERPWDRLCDQLNGRGVPSLEDALINLELRPAHDALRHLLDPVLMRTLAGLAEHSKPATGAPKDKSAELPMPRNEFFETAWGRTRVFLREAQAAYNTLSKKTPAAKPVDPELLATTFRANLRAAMRSPSLEALFPTPWTPEARRVLPSQSPRVTATAVWGPLLVWSVLELLAESEDPQNPARASLDLFDRLRLREPLAHSFAALGFAGEESWRVAARIKVALLTEARLYEPEKSVTDIVAEPTTTRTVETAASTPGAIQQPITAETEEEEAPEEAETRPILSPALWLDPDVRWLTGVHEAEGYSYFVKESYEELLWWLQMPRLIRIAAESSPDRSEIADISLSITESMAAAEKAHYRIDVLLDPKGLLATPPENPEINAEKVDARANEEDVEIGAETVMVESSAETPQEASELP